MEARSGDFQSGFGLDCRADHIGARVWQNIRCALWNKTMDISCFSRHRLPVFLFWHNSRGEKLHKKIKRYRKKFKTKLSYGKDISRNYIIR